MLKDFLQINFGTLMIIIFMLIFIKTNRLFAKKDENLFLIFNKLLVKVGRKK